MTKVDAPMGHDLPHPVYEIEMKLYGQDEPEVERVTGCEDVHALTLHIRNIMTVGYQRPSDDEGWTEIVPAGRIQRIKYREVT